MSDCSTNAMKPKARPALREGDEMNEERDFINDPEELDIRVRMVDKGGYIHYKHLGNMYKLSSRRYETWFGTWFRDRIDHECGFFPTDKGDRISADSLLVIKPERYENGRWR